MFESGVPIGHSVFNQFARNTGTDEDCAFLIKNYWGGVSGVNGAMWDQKNGICFAIFQAEGIEKSNSDYKTCLF